MKDQLGGFSRSAYDNDGRLTKEETPTVERTYVYDDNGNITKKTSKENGHEYSVIYDYNDRDQVWKITDQLGNATIMDLGLDGRIRALTDRKGHTTRNSHSLLGEALGRQNDNSVSLKIGLTPNRELHAVSDRANNTYEDEYDSGGRRTSSKLPNGATITYSSFNALGQPETIQMPRNITLGLTYDKEGKVLTRRIGNRQEKYTYDGMQRPERIVDPAGELGFTYDKLGFIRKFSHKYTSPPMAFDVSQEADEGGFRSSVTYPFGGATVANGRDITGRLMTLTPVGSEPVVQETTYANDSRIGNRVLGLGRIQVRTEHDELKRVVTQQYQRMEDGATLVDIRYSYDRDGIQEARQYLHRAGRADFFHYDPGHRLTRADVGVRPLLSAGESGRQFAGFAVPSEVPPGWAPGFHARSMTYNETDVLQGIAALNPDALPLPPLAERYGAPDSLLFVSDIDGFARTCDEIGQITRTRLWVRLPDASAPTAVEARLSYNDLGQLTRVERADGVTIENSYGPNSLRIRRRVTGDTARCIPSDTAFLYDGPNLIEEWDLAGGSRLRARYFYGDDGDELLAGDLLSAGGNLERHYFLTDLGRSVLAVTDGQGQVLERVIYDAWGQPVIERPDAAAPVVSQIVRTTNGMLVAFTETVLTAFASTPPVRNLFQDLVAPGAVLEVRVAGTNVQGRVVYEESSPPHTFGSTFRFITTQPLTGTVQLTVKGGTVQDEWNLLNPQQTFTLNVDVPAATVLHTGPAAGSTAPSRVARSGLNSAFLFQGQVFDYDSGLVYCGARFYDPGVGMFLQRDGAGYADGPNQYAGFGNNPVSFRDPTGQSASDYAEALHKSADEHLKKKELLGGPATALVYEAVAAVLNLGTGFAEGVELLKNHGHGQAGFLNVMHGTSLVATDVIVGVGSVSGAFSFCRGAYAFGAEWKRMSGWMQRVKVRSKGAEFLIRKGVDPIAVDAMEMAMKQNAASAIFREIRDPQGRLRAIDRGAHNGTKPGWIHTKTEGGTVNHNGRTYVSDIDVAEVFVNGEVATPAQRQKFLMDWNRNYVKLWRMEGRTGKPPVPVKHDAHLGMFDRFGSEVPDLDPATGIRGYRPIDARLMVDVGHPGDCVSVRFDGKGNLVAHSTPQDLMHQLIMERAEVLRNRGGPDVFSFPAGKNGPNNWNQFAPASIGEVEKLIGNETLKQPAW